MSAAATYFRRTMEDRQAKILEKVRLLLAHADGTPNETEAQTFREKAEALMTSYAIEMWQLAAADERDARGGKPEKREFDFAFGRSTPFRSILVDLFNDVARHCRCVPVIRKVETYGPGSTIPVIGLPSDLDYADLLFTTLLLQLMLQTDPQPSAELELGENVAMLREAGLDWQMIARRMLNAGLLDETRFGRPEEDEQHRYRQRHRRHQPNWYARTGSKLGSAYRAYCQKTGRPVSYVDQRRYRENFAEGFVHSVGHRLWALGNRAKKAEGGETMALVLRDIYEANQLAVFEFFPDLAPHARDCPCADCERRRLAAANRKPSKAVAPWKRERDRTDYAAYGTGSKAGERADIVSSAPKLGNAGQLNA